MLHDLIDRLAAAAGFSVPERMSTFTGSTITRFIWLLGEETAKEVAALHKPYANPTEADRVYSIAIEDACSLIRMKFTPTHLRKSADMLRIVDVRGRPHPPLDPCLPRYMPVDVPRRTLDGVGGFGPGVTLTSVQATIVRGFDPAGNVTFETGHNGVSFAVSHGGVDMHYYFEDIGKYRAPATVFES